MTKSLRWHYRAFWEGTIEEMGLEAFPKNSLFTKQVEHMPNLSQKRKEKQ